MTETPTTRRPGRPALPPEDRKKNKRSTLTLDGPIPKWLGYEDMKHLVKLYRGRFYCERWFKLEVEAGRVPSYFEDGMRTAWAGVRRRRYTWEDHHLPNGTVIPGIKSWIEGQMVPAPPCIGIMYNSQHIPPANPYPMVPTSPLRRGPGRPPKDGR